MIYLDYSATTYVDKRVLKKLNKNCKECGANGNSKHNAGLKAKELIDKSTINICKYLGIKENELIYTSGSSESNNMVIKGVTENYNIKKIITTRLEHSSIIGPVSYLQKKGIIVEFCELNNGIVDIEKLKNMIGNEETLVSICTVDSELGIRQPIEEIGKMLKDELNVIFHTDMTQAIGKVKVDLTDVDLASFSGHKIYTFKGIGCLVKKQDINITPLIHGGKSTTIYRSGTPPTELIATISDALDLIMPNIDKNYKYVKSLNDKIKKYLDNFEGIYVNNTEESIPHILNFSIMGRNSDDTRDYFNKNSIFISTKSACATDSDCSAVVKLITDDEELASSSVRISLSYKTKMSEVSKFLDVLKRYMEVYSNESNKS